MTFKELEAQRVKAIRKKHWNPTARLEFHFTESGHVGPWMTLIDEVVQPIIGETVGGQQVAVWEAEDDANDWEPYLAPADKP